MLTYFNKGLYKAQEKTDKIAWGKEKATESKQLEDFPSFQYYGAVIREVTEQTLLNWCKEFPEFLEAYNRCKKIQENILLQGGLSRAYDSSFAKFIMNSISETFKDKPIEVDLGKETKNFMRLGYALPVKGQTDEDSKE